MAVVLGLAAFSPVQADGIPAAQVGTPPYGLITHVTVPADPANPGQRERRIGCWATHFKFGCGSFRSDSVFIFGSCRAFFGEACMKGPPSIYPQGYGPGGAAGNGQGAYGAAASTCNCP
jgi:hypothetical protein